MRKCHIISYTHSKKHVRHALKLLQQLELHLGSSPTQPPSQLTSGLHPSTPNQPSPSFSACSPAPLWHEDDKIADTFNTQDNHLQHTYNLALNPGGDIYDELCKSKPKGDHLFPCHLCPATEEFGLEGDGPDYLQEDWFNENQDFVQGLSSTSHKDVQPGEQTYPLLSLAAQKTAVLAWAKGLNAQNVPTLHVLAQSQKKICSMVGNPTEKFVSNSGNIFYCNSIGKAIAKDYSNPITRFTMQDYPEDNGGSISQVHHGSKVLHDLPPSLAVPSLHTNGKIFSVNELLQQDSGNCFIPIKFFLHKDQRGVKVLAIGHNVVRSDVGFIVNPECLIASSMTPKRSFKDISNNSQGYCKFTDSSTHFASKMPHPLRAKSGGRLILTVPLIVFMDDVSENISKQWNKHHVVYMLNTSIPRNMIEKEFCIHFVVSSPHAAPMELMKGVTDSICKAEKTGIITWDCQYEEEIMLIPYELFVAGDNPMHAKECSHAGLKTNHFCRRCKVGETQVEKKSDKGYQKLFQSGSPRLPQETIEEGLRQDSLSLESGGTDKVKKAATSTGIRDAASVSVVQHLLELGKQLRKHVPGKAALPEADVCKRLEGELEELL
ncbi:hypothetical protein SERLADRAFT_443800 [Serpula lacrymans var. lacrymans S7.9]|uniref:Uncharacterized protein n=1 Tax=Serpula lacrymans var. lacrymans (strain S7.9) TaxID=578457 RepID=F8PDL2_SERL9|nr:uncharacterized protein SERLADRAFT_443800 [Serpula lacrymans var. lacrymans S7.9]EGO18833.1 hypothetical protein SERLADRAFT_443800 [Serpula lacrymans var. lacrymans S7.9]